MSGPFSGLFSGWSAVYLREMRILKRRLFRQLASMSVAPLLYLVAFGYGMGADRSVDGVPYVVYLVPGLIALNTMTQAYAISSEINIARFYHRIFEEFQAAPIGSAAIVAGEVAAGITRALLSAGVIVLVAALSGTGLAYGPAFLLAVVLNGLVFSSLAVCVAMVVKAHSDQFLLTSFVITPMAFLGGTFFPVDRMPDGVRHLLHLLPITQASTALRAACLGRATDPVPYIALALTGAALFLLACRVVARAKD